MSVKIADDGHSTPEEDLNFTDLLMIKRILYNILYSILYSILYRSREIYSTSFIFIEFLVLQKQEAQLQYFCKTCKQYGPQ
jgi:hypothetical protein